MPPVRRLTAILAADVAGYSRLMGEDEEETHERLKAHLDELANPKINEHRGRVVKNTGDGFLAEFASVVDAVRCAVEIQRGMVEGVPVTCYRLRSSRNLSGALHQRESASSARHRACLNTPLHPPQSGQASLAGLKRVVPVLD
jgi:hypothetical protein